MTPTPLATAQVSTPLSRPTSGARLPAAILTGALYLQLGWVVILVPALLLRLESAFGQSDAGFGFLYLVWWTTYTLGAVAGGWATERIGRRPVLVLSFVLGGVMMLAQGVVADWWIFLLLGIPRSFGSGAVDSGGTALMLDLYPEGRGRALNAVHLFFAVGATAAPFVVGALDGAGVAWQLLMTGSGIALILIGLASAVVPMPDGRHHRAAAAAVSPGPAAPRPERSLWRRPPILALGLAIGCYIGTEMGVSSWLVRFLADAPLVVATGALGLFWGGLMLGRLASAAFSDRFNHLSLAIGAAVLAGGSLAVAVLMPVLPISVALFGVVGFACGPIFPLIMALAGDRYPDRAAAVSGILTGASVIGSIVVPPLMGFLSEAVGMQALMLAAAAMSAACAGALVLNGRLK
jgi:fucose permease